MNGMPKPQVPMKTTKGTEKPRELLRTPESIVKNNQYTYGVFSGPSLGFSGASLGFASKIQAEINCLIPSHPVRLHGMWKGKPPTGSAEEVLFKIARLVRFSEITPQNPQLFLDGIARYVSERLNIDDDDTCRILCHGFKKANFSPDQSLIIKAKQKAQQLMLSRVSAYRDTRRHLLYCICEVLGRTGVFFLSTRDAGKLIGADRKLTGRWIKAMVTDGYLEIVANHTEFKAPRYNWRYRDSGVPEESQVYDFDKVETEKVSESFHEWESP